MFTENDFFIAEIVLENERAKLTPLNQEDIHKLTDVAYEPSIWKLGMSNIKEEKDLKEYIDIALKERSLKLSYPFLIFDRQTNSVAGSTRYGIFLFLIKDLRSDGHGYIPNTRVRD